MANFELPTDVDAERSVLAAALTSPEAFHDLVEHLVVEDFGLAAHQLIYAAMQAVDAASQPIDPITVADELRRTKTFTKAGGTDYLDRLVEEATADVATDAHAGIVRDKSLLRSLALAGRAIAGDALTADAPAPELLEQAEQKIFDLSKTRTGSSMVSMTEAVASTLQELARTRGSLLLGHSTGLDDLDKLTGGFQPGQLVVLAARPGMGKSALAAQMGRHIAETSGQLVAFFSYEMTAEELTMRMLSSGLRHNLQSFRRGDLPQGMERDLAVEAEKLAATPLYIDDNPPQTIAGVRSATRRLARRGELGAVIIDYCQLLDADRKSRDPNRVQEIAEITRGAKRMASELGIPVILLSQLSRAVESRPNKRPQLSDLRDSGSLEQDASLCLFLYRHAQYFPDADETLAELILAKQRNGPTGTVHLEFTGECARFATTTRRPPAGPSSDKQPGDPF